MNFSSEEQETISDAEIQPHPTSTSSMTVICIYSTNTAKHTFDPFAEGYPILS